MHDQYINIRRGQYICAILGAWAMTPWNILDSVESLVIFMDGYTTCLAPVSAILVADYWIVHRQRVSVPDMYRPDDIYKYNRYRNNWRALVAFVVGWLPLLPGFANGVNSNVDVGAGATNLYCLGYFYGFGVSMGVYVLLSKIWPARDTWCTRHRLSALRMSCKGNRGGAMLARINVATR